MRTFKPLYKMNSKGKIDTWEIRVVANVITISHGELNGKIQKTTDVIKEGKNLTKKNATTKEEQALLEAISKYDKMRKAGYIDDVEKARAGELDSIIKGGISPMLAHSYDEHGAKISFPCAGQPKLDGIRCIAIKHGEEVTLWTRGRKPIHSCPHIIEAISVLPIKDLYLDGELYNHKYHDRFKEIVSAVKKEKPTKEAGLIEYHIYDGFCDDQSMTFSQRLQGLEDYLVLDDPLILIETMNVRDVRDLEEKHKLCLKQGYEGLMVRNYNSKYENKRSYGLQKVKLFQDAEFKIVGAEEGRGKLTGNLGAFICENSEGARFNVSMSIPDTEKQKLWDDRENLIGQWLTVKFQNLTDTNSVPRFPVGIRVREDLDF